jgi:hypothetical protein
MLLHRSAALLLVLSAALIISCQDITGAANASDVPALSVSRQFAAVPNAIAIYTQQDLADIDGISGDYVLADDLVLTDWTPIFYRVPFTGTFNGAGHTITLESFESGALSRGDNLGVFAVIGDGSDSAVVGNLTVNAALAPIVTDTARNVGGLAGTVNNASIIDVTVTGTLSVTYNGPVPPQQPNSRKIFTDGITFYVRDPLPIGTDGLTVGGVAGTINPAVVQNAVALVSIDAASATFNVPVYVGGVGGYVNESWIIGSESSGNVTSNGPGYNTSAGGIAGYIIATEVDESSASGEINAIGLGVKLGWDDSWQVYAGGLVGYAGGTIDTASLIEDSHATGAVRAYSPFPYAGGLLGYAYGYNNFDTQVQLNGTAVRRTYATGDVTSISQPDPIVVVGDIPYAGGLVGYSSIIGSIIEDSYARGNVSVETLGTFAWAGGLIGGNANNSVVNRTYATGNVRVTVGETLPPLYAPLYADAGPAAGGIAGFDYYSDRTVVSNSVALNKLVHGNQTAGQDVVHRVVGSIGNTSGYIGTIRDNLAYIGMVVEDNWQPEIGAILRDGVDTAAQPAERVYTSLGWNFTTVWAIGSDRYPVLR